MCTVVAGSHWPEADQRAAGDVARVVVLDDDRRRRARPMMSASNLARRLVMRDTRRVVRPRLQEHRDRLDASAAIELVGRRCRSSSRSTPMTSAPSSSSRSSSGGNVGCSTTPDRRDAPRPGRRGRARPSRRRPRSAPRRRTASRRAAARRARAARVVEVARRQRLPAEPGDDRRRGREAAPDRACRWTDRARSGPGPSVIRR